MTQNKTQDYAIARHISDGETSEFLAEIRSYHDRLAARPFLERKQNAIWGDYAESDIAMMEKACAFAGDLILDDRTADGRRVEWGRRKLAAQYLAAAYDALGDSRTAERLITCGDRLTFGVASNGKKRIAHANFCRVRLCPTCQWRRSLKLFGQMSQVLRKLEPEGYQYVFLTLTVRNCHISKLSEELDKLHKGFNLLFKYKEVKALVKGWYRGMEVTHNLDRESPSFDTWHPHLHIVIAVNKSYFTSRDYLSQARWGELWQRALGADYTPRVDVRKVKGVTAQAVCEVTKYAAKSKDYIVFDDWDLTLESVDGLDRALRNRRMIGYGGVIRAVRAQLALDDVEEGDLVNVDGEAYHEKDQYLVSYAWHTGICQYIRQP